MAKPNRRFETPKHAETHVRMAAGNLVRAQGQIGKVTQRMVEIEAQRHGIPPQLVMQELQKRRIAISLE